MNTSFPEAKKKIAIFWFVVSAIIFTIVFVQTLGGKFEDNSQEAWGWVTSAILPNLTLMLSVFLFDIKAAAPERSFVDIFYYRITIGLSIFYLGVIILMILLQPLTNKPLLQLMKESSIYMGPFQGLVSGAIGLFFVKQQAS
ncbi:hypothetical protein [Chitinophaga vietnamensis]|uniref:hypothetical protein n=1 Tax=Chitinophaga vietnamensis TaxID=2593957 RepID=UPI0011789426|nr:hypothetical protein [Chitinophaga vietnamensis]